MDVVTDEVEVAEKKKEDEDVEENAGFTTQSENIVIVDTKPLQAATTAVTAAVDAAEEQLAAGALYRTTFLMLFFLLFFQAFFEFIFINS